MENEDHDRKMSEAVAHSIRNPIMIIGGFVRTLKKNLKNVDIPTNNTLDFLECAMTETNNLEGILDELLTNADLANWQHIERSIEFMPQYYQAGLSILSYFSTIVSQKYPDQKITVKIQQSGNNVKLIITTKDGNIEEIEKTLDQYGQVIKGEIQPEELCLNPFEVMSLKNKLDIAALELRHAEQLHRICEQKNSERITELEFNVRKLQDIVADGINSSTKFNDTLNHIVCKYAYDKELKNTLDTLLTKLNAGLVATDEQEIKQILENIRNSKPHLLLELKDFATNSLAGVSGNFLYAWITALLARV